MPVTLATWEDCGSRPAWAKSSWEPISKITRAKQAGVVAQAVDHLLCKCKDLSSNPRPTKKKKILSTNQQTRHKPTPPYVPRHNGFLKWRQHHLKVGFCYTDVFSHCNVCFRENGDKSSTLFPWCIYKCFVWLCAPLTAQVLKVWSPKWHYWEVVEPLRGKP
jgi:hypothetical protein